MQEVIDQLLDAAWNFQLQDRADRAAICEDIAAKLQRWGSFASAKQEAFALSLIKSSAEPVARPQSAARTDGPLVLPNITAVLERAKKLIVGDLAFNRSQRGDVWFTHGENLIGKLEDDGTLKLFRGRAEQARVDLTAVRRQVEAIEADPRSAVVKHGKQTGICGICGRELTDPDSIAAGIGPICAAKF